MGILEFLEFLEVYKKFFFDADLRTLGPLEYNDERPKIFCT